MQQAIEIQRTTRKPSQQMRAVLCVLEADQDLFVRVKPFIDFEAETIYWGQLSRISFGSGHRGALTWAYSIWTDEPKPRANAFDAALNMDSRLQLAVLKALAIRWGLHSGLEENNETTYHKGGTL